MRTNVVHDHLPEVVEIERDSKLVLCAENPEAKLEPSEVPLYFAFISPLTQNLFKNVELP